MMNEPSYRLLDPERTSELPPFFSRVFADSEGEKEGELIGALVRNLVTETPVADVRMVVAVQDGDLVGALLLTRLTTPKERDLFLMAPVAVKTEAQGKGIGQGLIRFSRQLLMAEGIRLLITYGDPSFYGKGGFVPVTVDQIPAPFTLSQPQGWLAQTLDGGPVPTLEWPAVCVEAFMDPQFW
jgi:predicted N-acetyltransferase YhbS